ncbi:MAG: two-component regulator propeller domain-containing protein [Limisphaerales bacterium]
MAPKSLQRPAASRSGQGDASTHRGMGWRAFVLGLLVPCCGLLGSEPAPPLPPVREGLIRWWPGVFETREALSGTDGHFMGLRDPGGGRAFDDATGWIQLEPPLTNQVFTMAMWLNWHRPRLPPATVIGQYGVRGGWSLHRSESDGPTAHRLGIRPADGGEAPEILRLPERAWTHVVLAHRTDHTWAAWVNGEPQVDGQVPQRIPESARTLTVGNWIKGDRQWHGEIRTLAVYDRELSPAEIQALYQAGLPPEVSTPPSPGSANVARPAITWSTNLSVAPADGFHLQSWTSEDGLVDNVVQSLLVTTDGYLWIGTEFGLSRFDGRRFLNFTPANTPALALAGEDVSALAEGPDGTLWAGTYGGLIRVQGLRFEAFTNGLSERFILQLAPVGDGTLWLAGYRREGPDRGPCQLRRYDPATGESRQVLTIPGQVRRLIPDGDGLWIAIEDPPMLLYGDGRSEQPRVIATLADPLHHSRFSNTPPDAGVRVRGWMESAGSLPPTAVGPIRRTAWCEIQLPRAQAQVHWLVDRRGHGRVSPWPAAKNSEGWMGFEAELTRVAADRLERVQPLPLLTSSQITALCANPEGGVWFGTSQGGLHLLRPKLVHLAADGLPPGRIRSVTTDREGRLVVACDQGVLRRDREGWKTLDSAAASVVAADSSGGIQWARPETGLGPVIRDGDAGPVRLSFPSVEWAEPLSLLVDRRGTLWVAAQNQVTWIRNNDSKTRSAQPTAPPAFTFGRHDLRSILHDALPTQLLDGGDGTVWCGTLGAGLLELKPDGFQLWNERNGFAPSHTVPVHQEESGALWLIFEGGLGRWFNGQLQVIDTARGLPHDILVGMVADGQGGLWFPGRKGLHRISRTELERAWIDPAQRVQPVTLGVRDGLPNPVAATMRWPNAALSGEGIVAFATPSGLALVDPSQVAAELKAQPTQIEAVIADGVPAPLTRLPRDRTNREPMLRPTEAQTDPRALRLAAGGVGRLEFQFSAPSLIASDRIQFRYRLDRHDRDWSPSTDLRLAIYTNLRPGSYRFRVKSTNPRGLWAEEEAVIALVIPRRFHQIPAVQIAAALLVIATLGELYRRRITHLRELHRLRETAALTAERNRIAADLHDDLGSALTQIAMIAHLAPRQSALTERTRSALERIADTARGMTSRMSDLVWSTDPRADSLDDLVAYLREHACRLFEDSPVTLQIEFPTHVRACRLSPIVRRNTVLAVKEALTNALKHASATRVNLTLTVADDQLTVEMRDNGRGFDPVARAEAGKGLGNLKRRSSEVDGTFTLESTPGTGTTWKLVTPLPPG